MYLEYDKLTSSPNKNKVFGIITSSNEDRKKDHGEKYYMSYRKDDRDDHADDNDDIMEVNGKKIILSDRKNINNVTNKRVALIANAHTEK